MAQKIARINVLVRPVTCFFAGVIIGIAYSVFPLQFQVAYANQIEFFKLLTIMSLIALLLGALFSGGQLLTRWKFYPQVIMTSITFGIVGYYFWPKFIEGYEFGAQYTFLIFSMASVTMGVAVAFILSIILFIYSLLIR